MGKVPTHDQAPRTNMFMLSGRWVNLYDPSPMDIELSDWVTGASRTARWGGQVRGGAPITSCSTVTWLNRCCCELSGQVRRP